MYRSSLRNLNLGITLHNYKSWKSTQNFVFCAFCSHVSPSLFLSRKPYNDFIHPFIKDFKGLHTTSVAYGLVGFKLADIGEGIAEVELIKWSKDIGDNVEEMDDICTVQSDKAAVEITSRYSGIIKKLYYSKGDLIKIGATIMDIDVEEEEEVTQAKEKNTACDTTFSEGSSLKRHVTSEEPIHNVVLTSPANRRIAKELNVDLRKIKGSGKFGRILREDIELFFKQSKAKTADYCCPVDSCASPSSSESASSLLISTNKHNEPKKNREVQLKGFSRAMFKMMSETLKIPHFNIAEEFDITDLKIARSKLKDLANKEYGVSITFTSLLIKAVSLSLTKIPILNSKVDPSGTKYIEYGSHNISIAIDTPNGLVVPNIKRVEDLSILEIQSELLRLQKLATSNSLTSSDLTGGTVSISNVGVIGGTCVKALLFDNQAMIIGIGRIQKLPRYDKAGNLCARDILNCSFSADHRHCDGATVARYSAELKRYLENPELMLLHMR